MKYLQSRINDYREMELVSLIQSQIAEPLWYYFDSAVESPNESTIDKDNKYLQISSIMDFVLKNNENIATYDDENIDLIIGYNEIEFGNRLNNFVLINKNSEILLWVSMDEPNYKGIEIEVSTSNNRIYKEEELFEYWDYEKISLIEVLNDSANYYMDIKDTCIEASSVINDLRYTSNKNLKFIINGHKCKVKK